MYVQKTGLCIAENRRLCPRVLQQQFWKKITDNAKNESLLDTLELRYIASVADTALNNNLTT